MDPNFEYSCNKEKHGNKTNPKCLNKLKEIQLKCFDVEMTVHNKEELVQFIEKAQHQGDFSDLEFYTVVEQGNFCPRILFDEDVLTAMRYYRYCGEPKFNSPEEFDNQNNIWIETCGVLENHIHKCSEIKAKRDIERQKQNKGRK